MYEKYGTKILPKQNYENTHNEFYKGWKMYGNPNAILLIITEYKEKNIFDQRAIQFDFIRRGVKAIMTIFQGLDDKLVLQEDRKLTYEGMEVGMIYFRAGFSPNHYDKEGKAWSCRRKI